MMEGIGRYRISTKNGNDSKRGFIAMKRKISYFILLFSLNVAICCAEEPKISSIEPAFGFGGDEVTINGSGFNVTDDKGNN